MVVYAVSFLVSALLALLLTPVVGRLALTIGAVDQPSARKIHCEPIPRLGGIAIFLAVALSIAIGCATLDFIRTLMAPSAGLAAAGFVILVLGAVDDVMSLSARSKLAIQLLAGVFVYQSGYRVDTLGDWTLGGLSFPVTLLWVVGITNAFNLIDGLDGLAAGVALIVSTSLFAVSVYSVDGLNPSNVSAAILLATLGGALSGFLRYNFHPAKIFLGDSGSLFIGFVLAVVSMSTSNPPSAVVAIVTPLLALGLPILETSLTVVRRLLRRVSMVREESDRARYQLHVVRDRPLLSADRQHIHHRLLDLGLGHKNAVIALYAVSALLGVASFAIVVARDPNLALLLAAFGVAAVLGIRRLDYGEIHVLRRGVLLPLFESTLVNRRMLHVLVDLLFILVSLLCALLLLHGGHMSPAVRRQFLDEAPLLALVQIVTFGACGLYGRAYRYTGFSDLIAICKALTAAILVGFTARTSYVGLPPIALWVLQGYVLATFVVGARLCFPIIEHYFKSERAGSHRVLIYGAGRGGTAALGEIYNNAALDMVAVGFIDDDPRQQNRTLRGLPVFSPNVLPDLVRQKRLDDLIVASAKIPEARLRRVVAPCTAAGITVRRFSIAWEAVEPAESVAMTAVAAPSTIPVQFARDDWTLAEG